MTIVSKSDALKGIREIHHTVRGKTYTKYCIYFGTDGHGGKIRESRSTRRAAVERVEEFYRMRRAVGDAAGLLKASELHDAAEAFRLLNEAGVVQTLTDTVRRFLEGRPAGVARSAVMPLGEAYEEYYAAIPEEQALHRRAVLFRVRPWVTEFGASRMVSEVTAREVAAYLEPSKRDSLKTYNNKMTYIKTFLAWCAKDERGYADANPMEGMKAARIPYREPEFMRADDFGRMVGALAARPDAGEMIPYVALSYMCGVRREEIGRMMRHPEKCILLDDDSVRVGEPKGYTQGRPPRMFRMPPNAAAWMRWAWRDGGIGRCKTGDAAVKTLAAVARGLGIGLPRNGGRHTFITMHIAAFENPAATEHIVDTSKKMRVSHYQGLVTKAEAERYFAIMPPA